MFLGLNLVDEVHSTVTDLEISTITPFLNFKYSCKIDKKGQISKCKYSDYDIRFRVIY